MTNSLLFCVVVAGLALSVFQLIYTFLAYRSEKDRDEESEVRMKALYALSRSLRNPVARVLARKSAARVLAAKAVATRSDKVD